MMKLTVTLADDGKPREAIPVRAIPFITGWNFSPDAIANAFSQTDEARRMRGILTFQITANSFIPVKAVDWENVKVAIDGLNDKLPSGPAGYADWRTESVALLPAGVFVWLDEFATGFSRDFSPLNWLPDCRGEHPSMNLAPMLVDGMASIIREGFPPYQEGAEATTSLSKAEATTYARQMPYGPTRDAAIASRIVELRTSGVRAYLAKTADEFGVSQSAIKEAVRRHKRKRKATPSTYVETSFAAQLSTANKRQKK